MSKMGKNGEDKRERVSERTCVAINMQRTKLETHGSPITNVSPAFTEGTRPSDPTKAAAASLIRMGGAQARPQDISRERITRTIGYHRTGSVQP